MRVIVLKGVLQHYGHTALDLDAHLQKGQLLDALVQVPECHRFVVDGSLTNSGDMCEDGLWCAEISFFMIEHHVVSCSRRRSKCSMRLWTAMALFGAACFDAATLQTEH